MADASVGPWTSVQGSTCFFRPLARRIPLLVLGAVCKVLPVTSGQRRDRFYLPSNAPQCRSQAVPFAATISCWVPVLCYGVMNYNWHYFVFRYFDLASFAIFFDLREALFCSFQGRMSPKLYVGFLVRHVVVRVARAPNMVVCAK